MHSLLSIQSKTQVHMSASTSQPTFNPAPSADSAAQFHHLIQFPLHCPSRSRNSSSIKSQIQPRAGCNNSTSTCPSVSNEDRRHPFRCRTTSTSRAASNVAHLTTASSSSSPRYVTVSLFPTPTPPHNYNDHPPETEKPSVYSHASAVPSAHCKSPSAASVNEKSLRHIGEAALDDSDSSEGVASESVGDGEIDDAEVASVLSRPMMPQTRRLSCGKAEPSHPSPLSRLAGQKRCTEDEEEERKGHDEDDKASASSLSTDTDGKPLDDLLFALKVPHNNSTTTPSACHRLSIPGYDDRIYVSPVNHVLAYLAAIL
ncbi:hypothetical protein PAXINDRAFT_12221 [Paxillus involutus ATCC 200175]|uniref:Uncharacterized protein n=1 Tax=Paxillus involutus ATCC 200175 TaxID=664439 RepID=A0A0C9U687_PAXIN|nr:hypothetical protein PAXINDRAFT_12221 [Paxillus involutus ATCC 200175]